MQAYDRLRERTFPCDIWYPAIEPRDVSPPTQTSPLVIFSHHSGGHRRSAAYLCTHLSSHGYVVAALDHSEVVAAELRPKAGETVEQKFARTKAWIASRVPDIRFLIDFLVRGALPDFQLILESSRIGIMGHSFGGWAALATPQVDERISAVVALAPAGSSHRRPGILPVHLTFVWEREVPTLFLVAENDTSLPLAGMYELFERAPTPKQMLSLRRADHLHFLDHAEQEHERVRNMTFPPELAWIHEEMRPFAELCSEEEAHRFVRGLTLCHFDATLRQRQEAQRFLSGHVGAELSVHGVDAFEHKS